MKKFRIKVNGNEYEVEVEEIQSNQSESRYGAESVPNSNINNNKKAPDVANSKSNVESSGENNITAPMPGTVLKINVAEGQELKAGEVILVLEAMKMENEITAPRNLNISKVHVKQGVSVNVGDVLVSYE